MRPYCLASAAAKFFKCNLYFRATSESYFVRGSLFLRSAVPPCDCHHFVAASFPPTFIVRISLSFHSIHLSAVDRLSSVLYAHTVQPHRPHEGDMRSQISVMRRAIEADVDSKGRRRPCWRVCKTVEAFL